MDSKSFVRQLKSLRLPLTEDEWRDLCDIFEQVKPGITANCHINKHESEPIVQEGRATRCPSCGVGDISFFDKGDTCGVCGSPVP